MAELAMLADIQRTINPEVVIRQLHVMVQARESSQVIDRHCNHCSKPLDFIWYRNIDEHAE